MARQSDPIISNFFTNSVTEGDAASVTTPGIFNFIVPLYGSQYLISQLPSDPPPYVPNNKHRDTILSITPLIEGLWSDAVNIAISKIIARGYEFKGPDATVKRVSDMFDNCDAGNGFHKFLARHLRDYLTTDNGAWVELERETDNPAAPVISFHHLDSLRCWRTGDPETPCYYYDLKGHYHAMKWWQVFNIVDMSSPRAGFYNSGLCAASRAYVQIRKLAAINTYFDEKITGGGATELTFMSGVTAKQITDALSTAEAEAQRKGVVYYKGKIIIPVLSDLPLNKSDVNLKGVPEGFDEEKVLRHAALVYAKSTGIKPTDLDPALTARGALGVGQAEQIQEENAQGFGNGNWEKQWDDHVNRLLVPHNTTHSISSRSLRDELLQAQVTTQRATGYKTMADAGFISAPQGTQILVDAGDLPEEFLTTADQTLDNIVTDEEQVAQQLPDDQNKPIATAQPQPNVPPEKPVPEAKELDTLIAATKAMNELRVEIKNVRKDSQPWYKRIGARQ